MSVNRRKTLAFVWAMALVTLLASVAWVPGQPEPQWLLLLALAAGVVALEAMYVLQSQRSGRSVITPALAVDIAALWLFGVPGALICACTGALANMVFRRSWRVERVVVNTAAVALAVLVAGRLAQLLGLTPLSPLSLVNLVAVTAAIAAYFAMNTIVIASAIALDSNGRVLQVWRQHFLWLAPQYLAMGLLGASGAGAFITLGLPGLLGYAVPLLAVYYSLRLYVRKADEDLQHTQALNTRLEKMNEQLIETMSSVVDARDSLLYGHSTQVALYAVAIGEELGLRGEALEHLRRSALLHDVGKVAVPEHILFKPGKLTNEEYQIIKHHAIVGERLVALVDDLSPLARLVGEHHEAWDGRGYPRGLRGDEISLAGRIICLCDALDTILSDRPYKAGQTLQWAVDEVRRCSGTQFDPTVVEAFLRVQRREGTALFCNSAYATAMGQRRSELFSDLRQLGLNVRGTESVQFVREPTRVHAAPQG